MGDNVRDRNALLNGSFPAAPALSHVRECHRHVTYAPAHDPRALIEAARA
jgi:hypothetical protein